MAAVATRKSVLLVAGRKGRARLSRNSLHVDFAGMLEDTCIGTNFRTHDHSWNI